ncbi:MAG: AMIN domain-containing protein [Desulfomonile tiedjei]|nr:AMIN domain-containing protein [Desulfomonile tiedjei]
MTNLSRRTVTMFACILLAAFWSEAPAANPANVTGVQVSPDFRQIMIKGDGPLGKHTAFVINQPYRLVVDFDDAGIGREVPARTKIGGDLINEIRLGKVNSRIRVVADFGENPVPAFKVHRQGNLVVVALDNRTASIPRTGTGSTPAPVALRVSQKAETVARSTKAPSPPKVEKPSGMAIKTSGVKDGLIFVELADRGDPKRVYRLSIDLDSAASRIQHATLSDNSGNVQRFAPGADKPIPGGQEEKAKSAAGPRREGLSQTTDATKRIKYHWGLPSVEPKEPYDQQVSSRSPFQVGDRSVETRVSAR